MKGKVAGEVHRIEGSQEADPKETIRQISDERKAKAAAAIPNQARIIDFSNKVQPEAGVKSRMKPKPRVSALKVGSRAFIVLPCSYMRSGDLCSQMHCPKLRGSKRQRALGGRKLPPGLERRQQSLPPRRSLYL